jgi:hypothetical protein
MDCRRSFILGRLWGTPAKRDVQPLLLVKPEGWKMQGTAFSSIIEVAKLLKVGD